MHINNARIQEVLDLHLHRVHSVRSKAEPSAARGCDELVLSSRATDIQKVRQAMSALPDVRTGLVNGLKHSLQSGDYGLAAQDVADNMLASILRSTGDV